MSSGLCSIKWGEYGHRHKSGGDAGHLVTISAPFMVSLNVVGFINVGFGSALFVRQCVVMSNFIIYGGRLVGRCGGICMDGARRIG